MPSYDFRCLDCGRVFELFSLGLFSEGCKVCPDCGGTRLQQLFTGFQFKHASSAHDAGCSSAGFR